MSTRQGFTVLEAAVALLIIGIASIGVLQALGAHTRAAAQAREQLELSAVALDVMSRIRLLPAHELSPLPDSIARGRGDAPFADVRWRASVQPVARERNLFEVDVEVVRETATFGLRTRRYVAPTASPAAP